MPFINSPEHLSRACKDLFSGFEHLPAVEGTTRAVPLSPSNSQTAAAGGCNLGGQAGCPYAYLQRPPAEENELRGEKRREGTSFVLSR